MAISQMAKVMIVSHRTEVTELLESLQDAGICQILNAEEAMVSKEHFLRTIQNRAKALRVFLPRVWL